MNTVTVRISVQRRVRRWVYPTYPRVTSNLKDSRGPLAANGEDAPDSACKEMSRCFGMGGLPGVLGMFVGEVEE